MAVQTLYKRTEQVWQEAQEHADKMGLSLSHYVELALAKFNAINDGSGYEVIKSEEPRRRGRKPKVSEDSPERLQRTLDRIRQIKKNT